MESATTSSPTNRLPKWAQAFIPNKEVKVVPVIISLNILVWVLMVANGVSPYLPSAEDALRWGATTSSYVSQGEYWRLLTSNYIHFGFLHLGMNMLALNNVGRMLERFIGPVRFAILYTVTGIAASSVSIWWNQYAVGAGASGAILGIVGVFAALLTTNLIDKNVRMSMLRSLAYSIGLTLLIGLSAHIDNAAHIAGLLTGAVGGYCIFPDLKSHYYERKKKWIGIIAAFLIIAGTAAWFVTQAGGGTTRTVDQIFQSFADEEAVLENKFQGKTKFTNEEITTSVLPVYQTGLLRLDTISEMGLNETGEEYVSKLRVYMNQRIRQFVALGKSNTDSAYIDTALIWSMKADSTLKKINSGE